MFVPLVRCQRNVYTHSDHSPGFEHSLWGSKVLPLSDEIVNSCIEKVLFL